MYPGHVNILPHLPILLRYFIDTVESILEASTKWKFMSSFLFMFNFIKLYRAIKRIGYFQVFINNISICIEICNAPQFAEHPYNM